MFQIEDPDDKRSLTLWHHGCTLPGTRGIAPFIEHSGVSAMLETTTAVATAVLQDVGQLLLDLLGRFLDFVSVLYGDEIIPPSSLKLGR